jgi:hypothetical protein
MMWNSHDSLGFKPACTLVAQIAPRSCCCCSPVRSSQQRAPSDWLPNLHHSKPRQGEDQRETMSSEGPYGRHGFQSNPTGYGGGGGGGGYGQQQHAPPPGSGGYAAPQYASSGYASYTAAPPQGGGGYGGGYDAPSYGSGAAMMGGAASDYGVRWDSSRCLPVSRQ